MKKIFLIIFLIFSACSTSNVQYSAKDEDILENEVVNDTEIKDEIGDETNEEPSTLFDPAIYVSVFTHAEEPSIRNQTDNPNYVENEDIFWDHREKIVEFAQMLYEHDVSYNYQSDWNFLLAATKYDNGTESTNEKNFLQYFSEDLGFEIDPHAHETKYNYADVAYLIKKLGVEPSNVVGGYIVSPTEDSKLEYLWKTIKGWKYDYSWRAEVGIGGGVALHKNEEFLWVSGIWKPKNNEDFLTHDDDAPLINIGHYKSDWEGLEELLEMQANGDLGKGKIYTIAISAHQRDIADEGFTEEFEKLIESFGNETGEDRIIWAGFSEVAEIWQNEFDSQPNQLFYSDFHSGEAETSENKINFEKMRKIISIP